MINLRLFPNVENNICVYFFRTIIYYIYGGGVMAVTTKTNRIDIRLTNSDKLLIEKAADFNRQSVSSYIISVIVKQAQLDIAENETMVLPKKDWDFIMELLENPGEPNEALVDLMHDNKFNL